MRWYVVYVAMDFKYALFYMINVIHRSRTFPEIGRCGNIPFVEVGYDLQSPKQGSLHTGHPVFSFYMLVAGILLRKQSIKSCL